MEFKQGEVDVRFMITHKRIWFGFYFESDVQLVSLNKTLIKCNLVTLKKNQGKLIKLLV